MENQDHKLTSPSGHENHAPHLCHKCGWPFPNPHPSARHRRAHKKVCGTIEGYKLSESEADNSIHSAVSDDDELSPSPKEMKSVKEIGTITDKSYRSEDETFSDAVAEFSDSGISPGMEERLEGVEISSMDVNRFDDKLLKADTTGGISGSLTNTAEVNNPKSLESATYQSEAAKSLDTGLDTPISLQLDADTIKSEIPVDAPLPEITATATIEVKQVQQMSSGQPNDLKESVDINSGEGLVDVVKVSQSLVSDMDMKTSNNGSYESNSQEAEGKISDPLSLPSDLHGTDSKISSPSPVESKLLEADDQAIDSVPGEAKLEHEESINSVPLDSKLDSSVVDVKALDVLNVDLEQEQVDKTLNAPILKFEADSSNEIDGVSQISKTGEEREEDVHVVSLGKDLPALDNPELMLKDFKDYSVFKSSLPLDLGSAKDDFLASSEVSPPSVALDVSGDQVIEENIVVSTKVKMDSTTNNLSEPGPLSTDHTDASSVKEEGKQSTKVDDDPVIEVTETSLSIAEESQGMAPGGSGGSDHDEHENARTEQPIVSATETEKEITEEKSVGVSQSEKTVVTATTLLESKDGNLHDVSKDSTISNEVLLGGEHEKARTEQPIVSASETEKERTEEKPAGVSESEKTTVTATTVLESKNGNLHEASKDSTVSNDAKVLESTSACDVKEPAGLLVDTDLKGPDVVDNNSHAGDGLQSATSVIASPSRNEGSDKLTKQNDTVSPVDMSVTSSSNSLDANWGSVSVLSTQSESTTAVPEKSDRDLQKQTSGAESDTFEPPSFMTLVESGESTDKKDKKATDGSEIETQQQPKTEAALKAGWFPSITNVVNESQGRKKNEEIIAKVTNWSSTTGGGGKQQHQHTPLKNLLGEAAAAKSPNAKQVPSTSANKKDETAAAKTTVNSILSSEAAAPASNEAAKEWNSPARYPVDVKKEKRKTKPYWVPFVCCSSVHQDA